MNNSDSKTKETENQTRLKSFDLEEINYFLELHIEKQTTSEMILSPWTADYPINLAFQLQNSKSTSQSQSVGNFHCVLYRHHLRNWSAQPIIHKALS